jgi:hypothetical protein
MEEPELIFHDTVPIEEEHIPEARRKAKTQKDIILSIFKEWPKYHWTPYDMAKAMDAYDIPILITSIRRSITDLTKEGRLIKCDYSNRKEGKYGTTNRTWRYREDYLPPLNPKR